MRRKKVSVLILLIITLLVLPSFTKTKHVNIWLIGDSTMAWKKPERAPESGWGEGLKFFAKEYTEIHNHAASSRSTRSIIAQKRWEKGT